MKLNDKKISILAAIFVLRDGGKESSTPLEIAELINENWCMDWDYRSANKHSGMSRRPSGFKLQKVILALLDDGLIEKVPFKNDRTKHSYKLKKKIGG